MFYRSGLVISTPTLARQNGKKTNSSLVTIAPCGRSSEHGRSLRPGLGHGPYRDRAAPRLIPIICDSGLRRVSPMLNHLLAVAMCAVDLMRPFSREFASSPVESAYADERPVHHALRPSCNGRLRVLPWSSPVKGSHQYVEKTASGLVTFAHC